MVTSDGTITGGAQSSPFSAPTYTTTVDNAPDTNAKQWAVTSHGGTQTANVRDHSISDPFTVTVYRPKTPRRLPDANPVTGKVPSVPRNTYGLIFRKGVEVNAAGQLDVEIARITFDVPAGADAADPDNIRAMTSFIVGFLNENSAGIGDMLVSGIA